MSSRSFRKGSLRKDSLGKLLGDAARFTCRHWGAAILGVTTIAGTAGTIDGTLEHINIKRIDIYKAAAVIGCEPTDPKRTDPSDPFSNYKITIISEQDALTFKARELDVSSVNLRPDNMAVLRDACVKGTAVRLQRITPAMNIDSVGIVFGPQNNLRLISAEILSPAQTAKVDAQIDRDLAAHKKFDWGAKFKWASSPSKPHTNG